MSLNISQIYAEIKELTKFCEPEEKERILTQSNADIRELITSDNETPKKKENFMELAGQALLKRDSFVGKYSWAIPTEEVIKEMAKFINGDIALEICAGTGLWALLLRNEGVQIIATDIEAHNTFLKIIRCDAVEAVNKFIIDVLVIIWPPFNSPVAYNSLKAFKGDRFIYIGEGFYGCTADDKFHELLEKEWQQVKRVNIPSWPMINDFMVFYEKKK